MIITYGSKKVERICNDSDYAGKFFQPRVVTELGILVNRLHLAKTIDPFFSDQWRRKYRTKYLKGKKQGIISLRLNLKNRCELQVIQKNVDGNDYIEILEVSCHYGD